MKPDYEYLPSLAEASNIVALGGSGNYGFVRYVSPPNLRIIVPATLKVEPQLRLERDMLEAIQEYMSILEAGSAADPKQSEVVRVRLERSKLKTDLGRRVSFEIIRYLAESDGIFGHVSLDSEIEAAVLVMDLRKSTSMMLKARSADFAKYMNGLLSHCVHIVKDSYGIFEKFTGDGFIALYVESLVGSSVARALQAAQQCRDAFRSYQQAHEHIFRSIVTDFGPAFGIDYGKVSLSSISDELNVVGDPVVYASRMASNETRSIILNNQARLQLQKSMDASSYLQRVSVDVKGEAALDGWKSISDLVDLVPPPRLE